MRDSPIYMKMSNKLARGLVNTITSPLEVPQQIVIHTIKNGRKGIFGVAAGILTGGILGTGYTVVRFSTGIIDILTFPLPIKGYRPLVEPEHVFSSEDIFWQDPSDHWEREDTGYTNQ